MKNRLENKLKFLKQLRLSHEEFVILSHHIPIETNAIVEVSWLVGALDEWFIWIQTVYMAFLRCRLFRTNISTALILITTQQQEQPRHLENESEATMNLLRCLLVEQILGIELREFVTIHSLSLLPCFC
jgi:hypothetical protein